MNHADSVRLQTPLPLPPPLLRLRLPLLRHAAAAAVDRPLLRHASRRHPLHPDMVCLLHTRRVPALPRQGAAEAGAEQPCPLTGDPEQPVWMCTSCAASLCRRPENIAMPPYALANLLWLGREPPCYQGGTLGARLLLSKGRPCWRKLILGRGAEEDLQKGISGNTILCE